MPSGASCWPERAGRSARTGKRCITTSATSRSPSWRESRQVWGTGSCVVAARLRCVPAMSIPHVDVKAQYAPLIPKLQDAFARTLETGRFIFGPEVESFEREAAALLGTQETVSCANGTDAIVLVLDALEIGQGDSPHHAASGAAETRASRASACVHSRGSPRRPAAAPPS